MIPHEGDLMALPDKILKKYGFHRLHVKKTDEGYDPGYTHRLRIHDTQYLLYDHNGFVTWERLVYKGDELKKSARGYPADVHITIPKPIRTDGDMKKLLEAIII